MLCATKKLIMKHIFLICFLLMFGCAMGQNGDLIYQPLPSVSISRDSVSLISYKNPDNELQNLKLFIYPSLDSIKCLTRKQLKKDLPDKIVLIIIIQGSLVKITEAKAIKNSKIVSLSPDTFDYVYLYKLDKKREYSKVDSLRLSIPINLK